MRTYIGSSLLVTAGLALASTSACEREPEHVVISKGLQMAAPPASILDPSGRRFSLRQANAPTSPGSIEKLARARSLQRDAPVEGWRERGLDKDFSAMSEAELAEALRPVTMVAGHEYILDQPDIEAARHYLVNKGKDLTGGHGHNPRGTTDRIARPKNYCCGADGRSAYRNNTNWFEATTVAMDQPWDPNSPQWIVGNPQIPCTWQMIGANTALSAAHCFHDSTNWYPLAMWGAAPDGLDAQPFPAGYPGAYGCYWVHIPAAYVGSGMAPQYDFAIVDLRDTCMANAGYTSGWQGWGVYNDTQILSSGIDALGVPGIRNNDVNPEPAWPQIKGMWINTSSISVGTYNIDHNADCAIGDSGRGSTQWIDSGYRITGIHQGGPTIGGKCRDRRFSTDLYSFLVANSEF